MALKTMHWKRSRFFSVMAWATVVGLGSGGTLARAENPEPRPEEILRFVRASQWQEEKTFEGRLRQGKEKVPFVLILRKDEMQFHFYEPRQALQLRRESDGYELRELDLDSNLRIPLQRYEESVRGTDITFEDITLRFLYWPEAVVLGKGTYRTRPYWKLRLVNPTREGIYGHVDAWVDRESGALLKVESYDFEQRLRKRFQVISGQKLNGAWVLKKMRVETLNPESQRVASRTYLEITQQREG